MYQENLKKSEPAKLVRALSVLSPRDATEQASPKQYRMQLRASIQRTKNFFHKNFKSLLILLLEGYAKLPKPTSFNPFSRGNRDSSYYQKDGYYASICDEWEADLEKAMKENNSGITVSNWATGNEPATANDESSCRSPVKNPSRKEEEGVGEEKNKKNFQLIRKGEPCSKSMNELAKKMKELEMMDASDVEHVLDVEEALHYYSRLRSPVYVDIVDNFFTNIYTEFSVPKASSASINSSKRRLGSTRL